MQNMVRKPGLRDTGGGSVFTLLAAASALLALLVLLFPGQLQAQLATADVLGTVTDSSGAVIPNAKVTLLNTGTGIASSINTNNLGEYVFSNVQIGTMKMTVEAKGFKTFTVADLALTAGQRFRVNAKLEVGSQVETIQVEASAAAVLQSDSSDINEVINTNTIDEMPTNGRNYYSLIELQPGAGAGGGSNPSDMRPLMSFSANGQSYTFNNNMIDGMDNNMRGLGTVAVEPSLDALQEVQVETSNYSAEYSRTGGGIANLITKSGTNKLHGSAFEFMRNDDFDAYQWEAPGTAKSKTELRQNQFGGSLGGPILKNKAFFFGDYQGWRQIQGSTSTALVPNTAEYNSIHAYASGQAQSITFNDQWQASNAGDANGNIVVSQGDVTPLGLAWLLQTPAPICDSQPNQLCGNTSTNWYGPANQVQHADTYDGRIDYHFNDKNSLYGRLSHNLTNTDQPSGFPAAQIIPGNSHTWTHTSVNPAGENNVALDYVHLFSPKTLVEAKASYLRVNQNAYTLDSTENWLNMMGYQCSTDYCYPLTGFPNLQAYSTNGTYSSAKPQGTQYALGSDNVGAYWIEDTFQYNGALTLNRGNHSIKTGVGLIRRQLNYEQPSGYFFGVSANYTGNLLSDVLEGELVSMSGDVTIVDHRGRMWEPSAYIQDDWRATTSLTLNLGVRYDIYAPMTDRDGNISNFDLKTDLVVSPNLLGPNASSPTGDVATDFSDVSPRIGFAYSFSSNNLVLKNMVLRGGYGISYFPSNTGQAIGTSEFLLMNAPFIWSFSCGVAGYTPSNSCGSGLGGSNYPSALPNGGYQLTTQYSTPAPAFDAALATDPSNYSSALEDDVFLPSNYKPAYLEQFNLQLQKQVGNNIVTAGFVGNVGRRLPSLQNINQPISSANVQAGIFPMYSAGTPWMNNVTLGEVIGGGNSAWEAGEATYERRLSAGLSANVNYTWARTEAQGTGASECVLSGCPMDNGSGTAIPINGWKQYNYTGSTSHVAAGMVSYNIPFGKSLHGVAGAAVKGWALNGTGSWSTGPWSQVTSGSNQSGLKNVATIGFGSRPSEFPNRVSGVSTKPANRSLSNWINPNAFALQTAGMLGNAKNNDVQGPRTRDLDLGLAKTFSLLEGFKLQFRAEAFNVSNTPSYSLAGGGGPGGPPPGGPGGPGGGSPTSISQYSCSEPAGSQPAQGPPPGGGGGGGGGPSCPAGSLASTAGGFGSITSVSSQPRIFQFGLKLIY
jgi:hypothetical protein